MWGLAALVFFILLLFAAYIIVSFRRLIIKINIILDDILNGNLNRRVNIRGTSKYLGQLCSNLNMLLDKFEENIQKRKHAEMRNKKLISDISHDLKTPLTSIWGYLEAIQTDKDLNGKDKDIYLSTVISKVQYINKLIQNFFEFSKLESDDLLMRPKLFSISEQVREVLLTFYHELENENISTEIQIPEEPLYVWGDLTSTDRILQNLFSNAIKYGKDGGVLGVNVRKDVGKVWVDVWDKGRGIPDEDIIYIFNRLFTTEKSRNTSLYGSGLGLSIVKSLVEKQNGEIIVSSKPWEKTIFSFYLLNSNEFFKPV